MQGQLAPRDVGIDRWSDTKARVYLRSMQPSQNFDYGRTSQISAGLDFLNCYLPRVYHLDEIRWKIGRRTMVWPIVCMWCDLLLAFDVARTSMEAEPCSGWLQPDGRVRRQQHVDQDNFEEPIVF